MTIFKVLLYLSVQYYSSALDQKTASLHFTGNLVASSNQGRSIYDGGLLHYSYADDEFQDLNRKSNATYTFRLRLFDNETSSLPWMSFPKVVEVTKRLFAEVQLRPIDNNVIDKDLAAIPNDCFFSVNSNPAVETETQHMVLQSGCSVNKAGAMFYKRDSSQQSINNHGIRFSILIDSFYFPSRQFMFFHCRATVCSLRENQPDQSVKMCPKDDYCTPISDKSTSSETPDTQYVNVFSGPLRPVSPRQSKASDGSGPVPAWTVDGNRRPPSLYPKSSQQVAASLKKEQRCPPCPVDDLFLVDRKSNSATPAAEANVRLETRGIDTLTVFCIAASSFLVGVLLMAGLCYVHKITEPKKCPNTASSCRKPLVDLQHSMLMSNNYYPPNNAENTASTNCSSSLRVVGNSDVDANAANPAAPFSANSVLLLAKPKLKLPCCYDPVDQNDDTFQDRGKKAKCQGQQRPLIEMHCDNNSQHLNDRPPVRNSKTDQIDDC